MKRENIFSSDRIYRFTLWRHFQTEFLFDGGNRMKDGFVQFIGLNPSKADENIDDNTLRRCQRFTQDWGYGEMCMTNLFALRETNPMLMKKHSHPVGSNGEGRRNEDYILQVAANAALTICAWGKDGKHWGKGNEIVRLLKLIDAKIYHLGLNNDGTPKHPLYLPANTKPILWTT